MGNNLPYEAFLKNKYGDSWKVKVAHYQNTDKFWFEEGWKIFVKQNKLACNDCILFKYDGKSIFSFKLFDENDDEKEYMRIPNSKDQLQDMVLEQMVLSETEQEPKQQRNMHSGPVESELEPRLEAEEEVIQIRQDELVPWLASSESQYSATEEEDEDFELDDDFKEENVRSKKKAMGRKRGKLNDLMS